MSRFRYALDPLCAAACVLYALNRFVLKPHLHSPFLDDHFSDLLLIPAALPLVLWLQRRLGLRTHDAMPDAREVFLHVIVWSVASEVLAPSISRATGDLRDVVCYVLGAIISAWLWTNSSEKAQENTENTQHPTPNIQHPSAGLHHRQVR